MSQSKRIVLVTASLTPERLERLKQRFPDVQIAYYPVREQQQVPDEYWSQAEILYTFPWKMPSAEKAPNLRWVQLYSAGADPILNHPLLKQGTLFTTASGVHAVNIAEFVFSMIQTWFYCVPTFLHWQREKVWPDEKQNREVMPRELYGTTIGIVGYGSIGRQIARIAKGYGMRVLAMQQRDNHKDDGYIFPGVGDPEGSIPDAYFKQDQFYELLKQSDIVVAAVPLTPKTQKMFDEQAFAAMKDDAFFVNIARGNVCDEPALIRALKEKRIAGAALDVFSEEPLPADSPLWKLPNVLLTPHTSGNTPNYDHRAGQIFEDNLQRYLQGEPLYNLVNLSRGY